ncbi:pyridoxine 5'-phosphate synthase [Aliarcobacter thereius]|uniref:Pyridoxine 5'-phosphate synthase n=2 Tax=Aliarcobacter thereius TaxID=544718 RepID=A0A5R9H564_9BACT|nr:pyridoxine 5'-phosphate synthase [Aliarcobacter thereius]OCL89777.1 Pyridoxine 5'-phosphate synthase [Aliarcobacter thereius]OCL96427.1 Pyridoxine 5'-phosphate synthase [Aliarcobacter thereius LMG 24486]QBF15611.1 pyridoxine 5'-phosphate synthase [Aliarcobacter thereius LMG 24486]TLS71528.1 pyridoxine 5'-phosphate synthase [Aliarcobacter thereius]TLS91707.1 pyridoxine 5'-phosphate synthase [Aliarcobacter thereius]
MLLGVNIDHIATLREARKINDPNPLDAVSICKLAGADQITIHLREDRRHIHDIDAKAIIEQSALPVNLECSINEDIIDIVCSLKPYRVTLVPENRDEVTTEGGLDLENHFDKINKTIEKLKENDIEVSLFIDPSHKAIELSNMLETDFVELHTGTYANIYAMLYSNLRNTQHSIKELELSKEELKSMLDKSLEDIKASSNFASNLGIKVAAGHGLNYQNVKNICEIKDIIELNIGQSIIARSVFTGLENAIKEMKSLINE